MREKGGWGMASAEREKERGRERKFESENGELEWSEM